MFACPFVEILAVDPEEACRSSGRSHVDIFERVGILVERGIDFHDDAILIELGENGGDLALAKGVVERVVDISGEDAEAGSGVAVDDERCEEAVIQFVAGDVACRMGWTSVCR